MAEVQVTITSLTGKQRAFLLLSGIALVVEKRNAQKI